MNAVGLHTGSVTSMPPRVEVNHIGVAPDMTAESAHPSPRTQGRIAGLFYALTIVIGALALFVKEPLGSALLFGLGALMAFGGLGWLTFVSPALANALSPYNMAPGVIGETVLTVWLLTVGINARRWSEQAGAVA